MNKETGIKRITKKLKYTIIKKTEIDETPISYKYFQFKDANDRHCSLEESTIEKRIIFGLEKPEIQIYLEDADTKKKGYAPYPIPDCVDVFSRMYLTQNQVKELIPYLMYFAEYGVLPNDEEDVTCFAIASNQEDSDKEKNRLECYQAIKNERKEIEDEQLKVLEDNTIEKKIKEKLIGEYNDVLRGINIALRAIMNLK